MVAVNTWLEEAAGCTYRKNEQKARVDYIAVSLNLWSKTKIRCQRLTRTKRIWVVGKDDEKLDHIPLVMSVTT